MSRTISGNETYQISQTVRRAEVTAVFRPAEVTFKCCLLSFVLLSFAVS